MKKQQKYCLEGEGEEIDTQNGRNNQQQVWSISYLKFKRLHSLYCLSAPETHQESTKACFEQSSGKKELSNGFPGFEGLEMPLIWSLYWKSATISS